MHGLEYGVPFELGSRLNPRGHMDCVGEMSRLRLSLPGSASLQDGQLPLAQVWQLHMWQLLYLQSPHGLEFSGGESGYCQGQVNSSMLAASSLVLCCPWSSALDACPEAHAWDIGELLHIQELGVVRLRSTGCRTWQ